MKKLFVAIFIFFSLFGVVFANEDNSLQSLVVDFEVNNVEENERTQINLAKMPEESTQSLIVDFGISSEKTITKSLLLEFENGKSVIVDFEIPSSLTQRDLSSKSLIVDFIVDAKGTTKSLIVDFDVASTKSLVVDFGVAETKSLVVDFEIGSSKTLTLDLKPEIPEASTQSLIVDFEIKTSSTDEGISSGSTSGVGIGVNIDDGGETDVDPEPIDEEIIIEEPIDLQVPEKEIKEESFFSKAINFVKGFFQRSSSYTSSAFVTVWNTENGGFSSDNQIRLPLEREGTYNFQVDWGDGTVDTVTSWNQAEVTHTYDSPGIYEVIIDGQIQGWRFGDGGYTGDYRSDARKLIEIKQWGNLILENRDDSGSIGDAFFYLTIHLDITATDILETSQLTSTTNMFRSSGVDKVPNIGQWDMSNVENMAAMFASSNFNDSINDWNVSSVKNMGLMFWHTNKFNQPLNNWDVRNVEDMNLMLLGADSFNQDISSWNVSKVKEMVGTFLQAENFNQDISSWDVSSVNSMSRMFEDALLFNQNLSCWDVSQISSEPTDFDKGSPLENNPSYQPQWGQEVCGNTDSLELNENSFVSVWDTRNEGISSDNQIRFPLEEEGTYDFQVDWGDGTVDTITSWNQAEVTHTYDNPGIYEVIINGQIEGWRFREGYTQNYRDAAKIIEIKQWGNLNLGNNGDYFSNAVNLEISATDPLNLSGTTYLINMFQMTDIHNSNFFEVTGNINNWDVSSVSHMTGLFYNADNFNSDISSWDISNVISLTGMFEYAKEFNQNISSWNLSSAKYTNRMFRAAYSFNQPLNSWDTTSVIHMDSMFASSGMNHSINSWNTSSVTKMNHMFQGAYDFNQPLNKWDTSNVNDMRHMFYNANSFNQNISCWNVSLISEPQSFATNSPIEGTSNLPNWGSQGCNQQSEPPIPPTNREFISVWNVSIDEGVSGFNNLKLPLQPDGTYDFQVDWGDGDTGTVTSWNDPDASHTYSQGGEKKVVLNGTIEGFAFNEGLWGHDDNLDDGDKLIDIQQWGNLRLSDGGEQFSNAENFQITATDSPNLEGIDDLSRMFTYASSFNSNINHWNVSSVRNMKEMFANAISFNKPLNNWDVSSVTNMDRMFRNAISFNQTLSYWDVSNVNNMYSLFSGANSFNQPLNNWNTSSVTNMRWMFSRTSSFNQPLNNWNTSSVEDMNYMFHNSKFNYSLEEWDVSNVKFMEGMFHTAQFNQPLNNWNTSSVEDMSYMFWSSSSFNQPLNNWDTSSTVNMNRMFYNAILFNQNISCWNVSLIEEKPNNFATNSPIYNTSNLPNWGTQGCVDIQPPTPTISVSYLENEEGPLFKNWTYLKIEAETDITSCDLIWDQGTPESMVQDSPTQCSINRTSTYGSHAYYVEVSNGTHQGETDELSINFINNESNFNASYSLLPLSEVDGDEVEIEVDATNNISRCILFWDNVPNESNSVINGDICSITAQGERGQTYDYQVLVESIIQGDSALLGLKSVTFLDNSSNNGEENESNGGNNGSEEQDPPSISVQYEDFEEGEIPKNQILINVSANTTIDRCRLYWNGDRENMEEEDNYCWIEIADEINETYEYYVKVEAENNGENYTETKNVTFMNKTVDLEPQLPFSASYVSPTPADNGKITRSSVTISVSATKTIGSCYLVFENKTTQMSTTSNLCSASKSGLKHQDEYSFYVIVGDENDNPYKLSERTFEVDNPPSGSSGGSTTPDPTPTPDPDDSSEDPPEEVEPEFKTLNLEFFDNPHLSEMSLEGTFEEDITERDVSIERLSPEDISLLPEIEGYKIIKALEVTSPKEESSTILGSTLSMLTGDGNPPFKAFKLEGNRWEEISIRDTQEVDGITEVEVSSDGFGTYALAQKKSSMLMPILIFLLLLVLAGLVVGGIIFYKNRQKKNFKYGKRDLAKDKANLRKKVSSKVKLDTPEDVKEFITEYHEAYPLAVLWQHMHKEGINHEEALNHFKSHYPNFNENQYNFAKEYYQEHKSKLKLDDIVMELVHEGVDVETAFLAVKMHK